MCAECNYEEALTDVYRALEHPVNQACQEKLEGIAEYIERNEHVTENQRWAIGKFLAREEPPFSR